MLRGFVCMHAMLDQVKAAWDLHAKGAASGGFSTIISEIDDFSEAVDAALNAVRATTAESRILSTLAVTKNPRERLLEISNEYAGAHRRSVRLERGWFERGRFTPRHCHSRGCLVVRLSFRALGQDIAIRHSPCRVVRLSRLLVRRSGCCIYLSRLVVWLSFHDFSEAVDAALNAVRATRQLGRHGSADVELADVIACRGSGL